MNRSTLSDTVLPCLAWVAACITIAMLLTSVWTIREAHRCEQRDGHVVLSGPLNTTMTCDFYPFRTQP